MRIGIDARFYGSVGKGLGRYTEKLIEHLEAVDTKNEYVVFLRRENFDEYHPKSPKFRKVLAQYQWYGFAEQLLFPFLLDRFRFDLVHFPHFNVPLLYRRPFIVTIHDLILLHYPTLRNTTRSLLSYRLKFSAYRWIIRSAIRRATHIITVSAFTKKDILDRYPEARGKVSVTYEAADLLCRRLPLLEENNLFRRLGLITEAVSSRGILQPYFLYVGNAYPHKNLEILLRAAPAFRQFRFVLVGKEDYFYTRLKREAETLKTDNVLFAGFLTDQELGTLYRNATIYIFPSLYEGFGLPPLEAMTYGLPVVSSDRGSLPEILGDAALYFNPERTEDLARVISSLLSDEERLRMLRTRGYERSGCYRWRDMALATLSIYQKTHQNTQSG